MKTFITDTSLDVQYLSTKEPTLTNEETQLFEMMNRETNTVRKKTYHTTLFDLSLKNIGTEWANNMIYLFKDFVDMISTRNVSMNNIYLLLNTDHRLFFIGLTCVMISFMMYSFDIVQ